MQNYNDLKSNEAQFLSVAGVKLEQFNSLVQFFEPCWEAYISVYTVSGNYRRRIKKQRKEDVFPDIETMFIFILSYMKNNPLQQAHACRIQYESTSGESVDSFIKECTEHYAGKSELHSM